MSHCRKWSTPSWRPSNTRPPAIQRQNSARRQTRRDNKSPVGYDAISTPPPRLQTLVGTVGNCASSTPGARMHSDSTDGGQPFRYDDRRFLGVIVKWYRAEEAGTIHVCGSFNCSRRRNWPPCVTGPRPERILRFGRSSVGSTPVIGCGGWPKGTPRSCVVCTVIATRPVRREHPCQSGRRGAPPSSYRRSTLSMRRDLRTVRKLRTTRPLTGRYPTASAILAQPSQPPLGHPLRPPRRRRRPPASRRESPPARQGARSPATPRRAPLQGRTRRPAGAIPRLPGR